MSCFSLSTRMRAFLEADAMHSFPVIGYRLPVSIRKQYSNTCKLWIFPEDGFDFFMGSEVAVIFDLAKCFDLSVSVHPLGDVVIIEVSDYNL